MQNVLDQRQKKKMYAVLCRCNDLHFMPKFFRTMMVGPPLCKRNVQGHAEA